MADFQSSLNQQKLLDLLKMLKEGQRDSQGQEADQQALEEELSNLRRTSSVSGDNFILKGKPTPSGRTGTEFMEPKEFYPPAKAESLDIDQFGSPIRGANPQGEPYSELPIVRPSTDVIETTGRTLPESSSAAESSLGLAGLLSKPGIAPGVAGLATALYPNTANAGADETGLPKNIPKLKQAFDLAQTIDFKNLPLPEKQKLLGRFGSNAPANIPTSSEMRLPDSVNKAGLFNRRVESSQGENIDEVLRNLPVVSPAGGLSALSRYKALMDSNDNSVAGNNSPPSAPNSNKPASNSGVPSNKQNRVPATVISPSEAARRASIVPNKSIVTASASTQPSSNNETPVQADSSLSDLAKQYKELLDKMSSSQKDFTNKYAEAKENEKNYQLMTDLAQAAGQIGAGFASTAGSGPISVDNSTLEKLQKSFTPSQDIMTQRAAEQQTLKDSLDRYYKLMEDQRKEHFENKKLQQTKEYQNAMLGLKRQEIGLNAEVKRLMLNSAKDEKEKQQIEHALEFIGKGNDKGQLDSATNLVTRAYQLLREQGVDPDRPETYGKNVQGVGFGSNTKTNLWLTPQGQQFRQVVDLLKLAEEKELGRLTQFKDELVTKAMSSGNFSDQKPLISYIKQVKDNLKDRVLNTENVALNNPAVREKIEKYKPLNYTKLKSLENSDLSSGFVKIQAPDGTTANVLKDRAQKYIDMGGKIVP